MGELSLLDPDIYRFPPTSNALEDPNGLLAVGGDLSPERLISAYTVGVFPWYSDGQPILWWTPDPRMILKPNELHLGRSLRKLINKKKFKITVDLAFPEVINQCETILRNGEDGTWITDEINEAYIKLHELGIAHSVEAWIDNELVGGLYGISLGKVFFGESMFSQQSGASKVAFAILVKQLQLWDYNLIDCQIHTDYLASFGATEVPRNDFESILRKSIPQELDFNDLSPLKLSRNWAKDWSMPEYGIE